VGERKQGRDADPPFLPGARLQADGNYALAVLLTVVTNTLAVFTIPGMLAWLADFDGVSLDVAELMLKLVLMVLLPIIVGKMASMFVPGVAAFVKRHKWPLKVVSIYALVSLPWILTSRAMDDGKFDDVTTASIFALIGWALTMHIIFLVMNFSTAYAMSRGGLLGLPELKAVVILASQKTLPVSIAVISALPESVGDKGLMAIACILAHLSQIVLDSFIIGAWVKESQVMPDSTPTGDLSQGTGKGHGSASSETDDATLEPQDGVTYAVVQSRTITFESGEREALGSPTSPISMPADRGFSRSSLV
jgi:predicted Na+-dependent transporter